MSRDEMKDNDSIDVRAKITFRGWAVWAAAVAIVLLLNGIVWILVATS